MKNTMQNNPVAKRLEIARRVAARLASVQGLTSVAVFGSVATGEADEHSDLDLAATYGDKFDRAAFDAACDAIGRDRDCLTSSSDPVCSMTALRVDGVAIGLMLGPESHLRRTVELVAAADVQRYRQVFRSQAVAIVLHDPGSLWPDVTRAVREAGERLGEYLDAR